MKVLFLPLNYGEVVQEGVYDAFRQTGAELEIFDYYYYHNNKQGIKNIRSMFIQKMRDFRPDLLHMQIQHTHIIDAESIRQARSFSPHTKVVNWTGDVRNYIPPTYLSVSKVSDYNLISSTGQLDMFRNAGVPNVGYWQIGYNPDFYYPEYPPRTNFDYDISFVANVNPKENYPGHNERMRTVYALHRTFGKRFGLFGNHWPKDLHSRGGIEQKLVSKDVYHRSFCVLSISHYNQLEHYFSDRLLMCLASGRPTVCWRFPGYQSYFSDGCDLLMANNTEDIISKVKYLLDHPDEANIIGMNGAAKVAAEHTYFSRINELFDIVGLKK